MKMLTKGQRTAMVRSATSQLMTRRVVVRHGGAKIATLALVDLGSTGTFIDHRLAIRLGLAIDSSLPTAGAALASGEFRILGIVQGCAIQPPRWPVVHGGFMVLSTLYQPRPDIMVVLGMDYLREARALIDCRRRKVMFPVGVRMVKVAPLRVRIPKLADKVAS